MPVSLVKDTIPRLHRIVDHPADQLIGILEGASTFEECRLRYGRTVERLHLEGRGRLTASRVSEAERNWAPTRDLLQELMRWKAIEPAPVPSSRRTLETYRERHYELTEKGARLAMLAQDNRSDFTTAVSQELISAHPYFRRLLEVLESGPIICPVPTEGDVSRGRGGVAGWAEWGSALIGGDSDPARVEQELRDHLDRRFSTRRENDRPSNKAIAETLTDAFAVAGFGARGIHTDGPTIKTLQRWGTELLVFDQSRYVPRFPAANVLWAACDLEPASNGLRVHRRGKAGFGERVARALVDSYRQLHDPSNGITVPVHQIRAQAAFESGTTRALCDLVLSDLIEGHFSQLQVKARAFIGSCELPRSEPAFRHRNRVRLEVQMVPAEDQQTPTERKQDDD